MWNFLKQMHLDFGLTWQMWQANLSEIASLLLFDEHNWFDVTLCDEVLFFGVRMRDDDDDDVIFLGVTVFKDGLLLDVKYFDKGFWFKVDFFGFKFSSFETIIENLSGILFSRSLWPRMRWLSKLFVVLNT